MHDTGTRAASCSVPHPPTLTDPLSTRLRGTPRAGRGDTVPVPAGPGGRGVACPCGARRTDRRRRARAQRPYAAVRAGNAPGPSGHPPKELPPQPCRPVTEGALVRGCRGSAGPEGRAPGGRCRAGCRRGRRRRHGQGGGVRFASVQRRREGSRICRSSVVVRTERVGPTVTRPGSGPFAGCPRAGEPDAGHTLNRW